MARNPVIIRENWHNFVAIKGLFELFVWVKYQKLTGCLQNPKVQISFSQNEGKISIFYLKNGSMEPDPVGNRFLKNKEYTTKGLVD